MMLPPLPLVLEDLELVLEELNELDEKPEEELEEEATMSKPPPRKGGDSPGAWYRVSESLLL